MTDNHNPSFAFPVKKGASFIPPLLVMGFASPVPPAPPPPSQIAPTPPSDVNPEQPSLFNCWQLPATALLLSTMSPSQLKVLSLEDIDRALCDPVNNLELLASMHARVLGIGPTAAAARWLPTLRRYAHSFQSDFSRVLVKVSNPLTAVPGHTQAMQEKAIAVDIKGQKPSINGLKSPSGMDHTANGNPHEEPEDAILPANKSNDMVSPANGHAIKKEKTEADDAVMSGDVVDEESALRPSENGKTKPIHTLFPALTSMETYSALSAKERLSILHTITEIIASETVNTACSARLLSLSVEELRLAPFGYDAAGNVYWYFGDAVHLFREPGPRRAGKNIVESKRKSKTQLKINLAEKKARQAEKRRKLEERRRIAEKKRKEKEERARKKEEERERKRLEARAKWAPRHPSARVTRGARAAESAAVAAAERETSPIVTKMVVDSTPQVADNAGEDDNEVNGHEPENGHAEEGSTEIDGGSARKRTREEVEMIDVDENGNSGDESEDTYDPAVRDCTSWECVCHSVGELKRLIERFGKIENVRNKDEKGLLKALSFEILPLFEAAEKKAIRAAKKEMMMQIASVRKRSARVMAMEAAALSERNAKKEAKMAMKADAAEERRIQREEDNDNDDDYSDENDEDHVHEEDNDDDEDDMDGYNGVQTRRSSARLSKSARKEDEQNKIMDTVGVTTRTRSSARLS